MPTQLFVNNFSTSLSASALSTDTVLYLTSVTGLPDISSSDSFSLTIKRGLSSAVEIVTVSSIDIPGKSVTVTRGSESTTALNFNAGDIVEMRVTAHSLSNYPVYDTVADMVASVGTRIGQFIGVKDYATGNNSGVLFFKAVAAGTGTTDGGSYIDSVGVPTVQFKQNFPALITVKMFGCKVNGVADDYTQAQAAIDYMESIKGGKLDCCVGTLLTSETLIVDDNNVLLLGHGKGYITNSKTITRDTIATRFLWGGAPGGVVLRFTSNRNNDGTLPRKHGGGISQIGLDGNETAGKCFELESWNEGYFDFLTCYATDVHWHLDVLSNSTTPGPSDSQGNIFDITSHDVNTTAEANTLGILHGNTAANTSLNYFRYLNLTAESAAVALELGGCDGNAFGFVRTGTRAAAVGNGGKIILHADDTMTTVPSTGDHCRYNNMNFVQASKGVTSKATIAGTDSASDNSIEVLSGGNGSPFPSVEAGSVLIVNNYNGTNRASFGDGSANYTVHRPKGIANNNIGNIRYDSEDDSGANLSYTRLACRIVDPTNGSEDGQWEVYTRQAGAETRAFYIWKGVNVGSPAGGDKGAGTVNAQNGYYNNGIPWFTGAGSPEGVVTGPVGSFYSRTDGGASTTFYVKESGAGNTGWVAK